MIALALDIGGARTGIAVSDRTGRVASPVKVLPAAEVEGVARTFRMVLEDYEPDVIVCGLPQTMAGEEGSQAARRVEAVDGLEQAQIADLHEVVDGLPAVLEFVGDEAHQVEVGHCLLYTSRCV